jgi:hypothetical protein
MWKATEVNAIRFQKHGSMQRKENTNIRQQITLNNMPSSAQFTNLWPLIQYILRAVALFLQLL